MTWPVVTIGPDADVAEAARLLRRHLIRRLPVVDSAGRLVGIISHSDVLKIFLRADEEIRREIVDQLILGGQLPGHERIQVSVRDGVVLLEGVCGGARKSPAWHGPSRASRVSCGSRTGSASPWTMRRPCPTR